MFTGRLTRLCTSVTQPLLLTCVHAIFMVSTPVYARLGSDPMISGNLLNHSNLSNRSYSSIGSLLNKTSGLSTPYFRTNHSNARRSNTTRPLSKRSLTLISLTLFTVTSAPRAPAALTKFVLAFPVTNNVPPPAFRFHFNLCNNILRYFVFGLRKNCG